MKFPEKEMFLFNYSKFLNVISNQKGYLITFAYYSFLQTPDKNNRFFTYRFFESFEKIGC